MNVVIEVKGPAGSGTSALAQSIAAFLNTLDLSASTDLSVNLRNIDELQGVIDAIRERGTHIAVGVSPIEGTLSLQEFDAAVDAAEEDGTLTNNWTPPTVEPAADYTERSGRWLNRHERMAERNRVQDDSILD